MILLAAAAIFVLWGLALYGLVDLVPDTSLERFALRMLLVTLAAGCWFMALFLAARAASA